MPITEKELDREVLRLTTTGTYTKAQPRNPWTNALLIFLEGTGIEWELCIENIGPIEIVKIHDDKIKFLLSMPNGSYQGQEKPQFLWMTGPDPDKEEDVISPDDASSYLMMKKFPDIEITNSKDAFGREITDMKRKEGENIKIIFPNRNFRNN